MSAARPAQPTFEECMREAYEEYVRGWLDEHPQVQPSCSGVITTVITGNEKAPPDPS